MATVPTSQILRGIADKTDAEVVQALKDAVDAFGAAYLADGRQAASTEKGRKGFLKAQRDFLTLVACGRDYLTNTEPEDVALHKPLVTRGSASNTGR